jgi:hypothetical protein
MKDAVVIDRDTHNLSVPLIVEAPCEEPAAHHVRLTDELDSLDVTVANEDIHVMDDEVPTRQDLVVVDADDREIRFVDDVAGRLPTSGDRVEASIECASLVLAHVPRV